MSNYNNRLRRLEARHPSNRLTVWDCLLGSADPADLGPDQVALWQEMLAVLNRPGPTGSERLERLIEAAAKPDTNGEPTT